MGELREKTGLNDVYFCRGCETHDGPLENFKPDCFDGLSPVYIQVFQVSREGYA